MKDYNTNRDDTLIREMKIAELDDYEKREFGVNNSDKDQDVFVTYQGNNAIGMFDSMSDAMESLEEVEERNN